MPSTAKARWAMSALDSALAPVPQKRLPNQVPTMQRRSRWENSLRPVMPAGPCSRWTISRSSCSPRSRWSARRSMYARGWSIEVYGPHENQRVTSGSPASSSSAGASSGTGTRRVSVGPCNAMLALLFDIHGNLPALEAVLDDTRAAGARRYLLGGAYAVFGGWPAESVARLRELPDATWIRGNVDRWAATEAPDDDPVRSGIESCRALVDAATIAELGALPESADLGH